ncbi:hypothetical protein F2Q68_00044733 [Brassica cretica]|uniref:Reverse transcriptase zinc-binding domain-containing protein n=1 Tax=Brassica cretica TaxID=69181 RepID=A0A8S9LKC0_BRACR|nr:hypothetical protein F2Q68_00044733 [Brassica cretica]
MRQKKWDENFISEVLHAGKFLKFYQLRSVKQEDKMDTVENTRTSKLVERHCRTYSTCQLCGAAVEDINHIVFECPPAFQCWAFPRSHHPQDYSREREVFQRERRISGHATTSQWQMYIELGWGTYPP